MRKYNLMTFRLSIEVYNNLADSLFLDFHEAISNEILFQKHTQYLEKLYGIKLDINEFNKQFKEDKQELVSSQNENLNKGVVFSVIASLVCELALKLIIIKNDSDFPKTHNLEELFNKLKDSDKDSLKKYTMEKCKFTSPYDFDSELKSASGNFMTLRYFFEGNEHEVNDLFLKGFKDSLMELV